MTDVTNALNAGHEVTISQSQINFKGWKGSGYIIIDPNNGSGAYLISGGANGGILLIVAGFAIIAIAVFAFIAIMATTAATAGATLGAALLAVPEFLAAIAAGVALIARGFEIITGSYTACKIYRFALGISLGAFLAKYNWFIGLLIGAGYSGMGEFLNSDVMCDPNTPTE